MSDVKLVEVTEEEADIRLDRWFRRHYPAVKHGRLEKLLRTGQVRVDGGRVKGSTRLEPGQSIRVPPLGDGGAAQAARHEPTISTEDRDWIRGLVIHQDDDVIALNKPSGIAVQGGRKITRHIDGLLDALAGRDDERPKLVHRLDRDTSGVLLIARSARSAKRLGDAFQGRDARKRYWALVAGVPKVEQGRIDEAILKQADADGYEKMVADADLGKSAVTDYRVLEAAGRSAAWLEMMPQTGRTHQLRIHSAGIGNPIVGDRKYGGEAAVMETIPGGDKLHLHARSIDLPHPAGGRLRVTAELSDHMAETWRFFGFDEQGLD